MQGDSFGKSMRKIQQIPKTSCRRFYVIFYLHTTKTRDRISLTPPSFSLVIFRIFDKFYRCGYSVLFRTQGQQPSNVGLNAMREGKLANMHALSQYLCPIMLKNEIGWNKCSYRTVETPSNFGGGCKSKSKTMERAETISALTRFIHVVNVGSSILQCIWLATSPLQHQNRFIGDKSQAMASFLIEVMVKLASIDWEIQHVWICPLEGQFVVVVAVTNDTPRESGRIFL